MELKAAQDAPRFWRRECLVESTCRVLYADALINVTSFFRDPDAFDILKREVFSKRLRQRGDEPFRVWVLGCSSGEEANSIAMAFMEAAEKAPRARKLQVFATDLNEALLDKARRGLYAKSVMADVSAERRRRFFIEEDGGVKRRGRVTLPALRRSITYVPIGVRTPRRFIPASAAPR